jgi:glycine/D-amino acid oxidase-like deaminating enzyme
MEKSDFILVGQGLAGSILAMELISLGKKVLVIDDPSLSSCSKVAGGIYNPVVFKRLTKSWMADQVLPVMFDFFAEQEKKIGVKLLYDVPVAHILTNTEEKNLWEKKSKNELTDFIEKNLACENDICRGLVKQSGFVDVPAFLQAVRKFLRENNSLLEDRFNYADLCISENIEYKSNIASSIIFCEGHLAQQNPWFSAVKFKPAKGEVLLVECPQLETKHILNKDIFILPLPEKGRFKIGATYNWDDLTDNTTNEAREFLAEKAKKLIPYPFTILAQQAGVRPSSLDRRPVIGFHPEHKNLGIFNGFGTKAVMLAPFFAKHFCSFMQNKTELLHEVNVKRFFA